MKHGLLPDTRPIASHDGGARTRGAGCWGGTSTRRRRTPPSGWGSCVGTYAFASLAVDGLTCYDPFPTTDGCEPRTHYSAIHLNKAFDLDCMPRGATLSLSGVEYYASAAPDTPLDRPKCAQCEPCCGSCSAAGFEDLRIRYADGSVPQGSCMSVHAGPTC